MSLHRFIGGDSGAWRIEATHAVRGPGLAPARRDGAAAPGTWELRGVASNLR